MIPIGVVIQGPILVTTDRQHTAMLAGTVVLQYALMILLGALEVLGFDVTLPQYLECQPAMVDRALVGGTHNRQMPIV
jgi:hypothetical protein